MKKITIFILSLIVMLSYSCEDDGDAIYLSHKLIIEVQETSDYYITISWNNLSMNNYENFILVESYEEKGIEFYSELAEVFIDFNYYDQQQFEMTFKCELHDISAGNNSHQVYTRNENQVYFKLLAYNKNGEFIFSNLIKI
ncbi:MAG: hypothetical protein GQ564_17280 [Bacteroidales bacterium]|nr:hypothetical protein [Bacteroidales bacterium]